MRCRSQCRRAYPVTKSGAGYDAEVVDILNGASRDKWFRPSGVVAAPDGSLIVADWYDPGWAGIHAGPRKRPTFLVAPDGHQYQSPKVDVSKIDGAIAALKSPNQATRYLAWHALRKLGKRASRLAKTLG